MKHDLAELKPVQKVTTIGFLCLEGFPLEQLSVALNYLKSANQFEAGPLFQTRVVSFMGGEVESCCGLRVQTRMIESEPQPFQFLFVLGGVARSEDNKAALRRCLRMHLDGGAVVAVIDGAAVPVAKTGVLNGVAICMSQQVCAILEEDFSDITALGQASHSEGRVWSADGGFALLNLLSDVVFRSSGQEVRAELDRRFLHFQRGAARRGASRIDPAYRGSALTGDGVVDKAIELIRQNLERPVLLTQIARDVGISLRQLERKFLGVTGLSPKAYYMAERLERADMLIRGTSLTMPEIALACGFGSYSSFSQRYRKNFGDTPMRRRASM
ncbi:GlxA family transcriptional regulator [Aliiroseovarius crassostreae]|uniref:GlxA family transcriptional regulator n=1 Tax=Aliiroseovarius crassostreae TaxID=154981 RepID=UPI0021AE5B9C|nr:helix-turn-helix domain-containing protein [Aliiroseovarius crassostreae]UWP89200.1 helix-turn-helix domain-containing protein [Aliiroseovarius crassostreae]